MHVHCCMRTLTGTLLRGATCPHHSPDAIPTRGAGARASAVAKEQAPHGHRRHAERRADAAGCCRARVLESGVEQLQRTREPVERARPWRERVHARCDAGRRPLSQSVHVQARAREARPVTAPAGARAPARALSLSCRPRSGAPAAAGLLRARCAGAGARRPIRRAAAGRPWRGWVVCGRGVVDRVACAVAGVEGAAAGGCGSLGASAADF